VLLAVNFDVQLCFRAIEVEPIGQHGMISTNAVSDAMVSKIFPEAFLGERTCLAQAASSGDGAWVSVSDAIPDLTTLHDVLHCIPGLDLRFPLTFSKPPPPTPPPARRSFRLEASRKLAGATHKERGAATRISVYRHDGRLLADTDLRRHANCLGRLTRRGGRDSNPLARY